MQVEEQIIEKAKQIEKKNNKQEAVNPAVARLNQSMILFENHNGMALTTSRAQFNSYYQHLHPKDKPKVDILDSDWLGGNVFTRIPDDIAKKEFISGLKITGLAEEVRRFKADYNAADFIDEKSDLDLKLVKRSSYSKELQKRIGYSTRFKIIKALACDEPVKPITATFAGITTHVLTEDEINAVKKLVADNPEPKKAERTLTEEQKTNITLQQLVESFVKGQPSSAAPTSSEDVEKAKAEAEKAKNEALEAAAKAEKAKAEAERAALETQIEVEKLKQQLEELKNPKKTKKAKSNEDEQENEPQTGENK